MIGKNSSLPLSLRLLITGLLVALLISAGSARAAEVTLAWDPNQETELSGYRVFSGSASRNYAGAVDVGNRTSCVLSGLEPGKTYYFAAKAYNNAGEESDYSSEVVYSLPAACVFSVSPASQAYSSSGGSGSVAVATGSTCGWTAAGSASWLTVTAGSSGVGPGSVSFAVAAQTGSDPRTATLTVAGQAVTVSQSGYSGSFTISASAGRGGFISPAGMSKLTGGASRTFTVTPQQGYSISAVQVDGVNVGALSSYTFTNVTAGHTIRALFKKQSARFSMFSWQ